MNLTEVDKFIIVNILDYQKKKKPLSSWILAKRYPWTNQEKGLFITEKDETNFFTDKTTFIDYRIKKLEKDGLVKVEKDEKGHKVYSIPHGRVKKLNHKFIDKYAIALLLKEDNGKYAILEL